MPTYKTKAIILSSYPYREHDRIVSFYSEDYGLLSARARGCRKLASKLAGHLEPFIETELLLARGRRWDILAGSRTVAAQARLRSRLEGAAAAAVCCEAVRHVSKPMAPDARVWELLRGTLSALSLRVSRSETKQSYNRDKEGDNINILNRDDKIASVGRQIGGLPRNDIVYHFLWQLLSLSGFAPEIKKCVHCRRRVNAGYFSNEGGGALCPDCCGRDPLAVKVEAEDMAALGGRQENLSNRAQSIIIGWWQTVVSHAPLRSLEFWEGLIV